MNKFILAILIGTALGGCDNKQSVDGIIAQQCGDYYVEMSLSDTGDSVHAVINGDAVDLALAVSASGSRYVGVLNDTDVTLWNKGDEWTMFLNDEEPIVCRTK